MFLLHHRSVHALLLAMTLLSLGSIFAASPACGANPGQKSGIFARDNLVAWCIVPFDAGKRGPTERAAMLRKLGLTKLAYDWREEHVETFEEEIVCMKEHGIEYFAHWTPLAKSPSYTSMMQLIRKHKINPQIWTIAPAAPADTDASRVALNARAMLPFVLDAKRLGCTFAIYNHGGWSGEPDNMIAMAKWLRTEAGTKEVGIVYNFHHGHEHLKDFPAAFKRMLPYLTCVNLNGMTVGGPKILPLEKGQEDQKILEMIRDCGYEGPLGILDHRPELDAEKSLQENLQGLQKLLVAMGETAAAETYGR